MNTIVYFYSHKGSNRFLAKKIATDLQCDIEEISPRLNAHLLMLMGINFGNRRLKKKVADYDRIILCGPIWMGKLIVPLRNFLLKNRQKIRQLVFVTCCGSKFEQKDEKFGHNLVFNVVRQLLREKCAHCEAFPKTLVLPPELKDDPGAFMKTTLSEENFTGEITNIYDRFIATLKSE
jgi:menaquinone-dependent protoporphyrinogen IX oxidase